MKLLDLLLEASPKEIYDKYYSDIPFGVFNKIVSTDPQTKKDPGGDIKKIGTYAKLLLRMYKNGNLPLEDLPKANEYLGIVYNNSVPLDTQKIKSLPDMYDLVKKYIARSADDFYDVVNVLDSSDYDKVFEGEEWDVFIPLNAKSSCYLGVGTEWCTTWGSDSLDPKLRSRTNRYAYYTSSGPLYIIVSKNNPNEERYQFAFEKEEYKDIKNDNIRSVYTFFQDRPELFKFFFPSFDREVDKKQLDKEWSRRVFLTSDQKETLLRKKLPERPEGGSFSQAILDGDVEENFRNYVDDPDVDGVSVGSDVVEFSVSNSFFNTSFARQYKDLLNVLSRDADYMADFYDVYIDDEELNYIKERYLNKYFADNSEKLKKDFFKINRKGIDEEEFLAIISPYLDGDKIKEIITEFSAETQRDIASEQLQDIRNEYGDFIEFPSSREVSVNKFKFLEYVQDKDIEVIVDLAEFLEELVEYNNLALELSSVLEDRDVFYPTTHYPELNEMGITDWIEDAIQEFMDQNFEDDDGTNPPDPEDSEDCRYYKSYFAKRFNKYFKGRKEFENEFIKVELKDPAIDCDTGTVRVKVTNKKTGTIYGERDGKDTVSFESLENILNTVPMFEQKKLSLKRIVLSEEPSSSVSLGGLADQFVSNFEEYCDLPLEKFLSSAEITTDTNKDLNRAIRKFMEKHKVPKEAFEELRRKIEKELLKHE